MYLIIRQNVKGSIIKYENFVIHARIQKVFSEGIHFCRAFFIAFIVDERMDDQQ